MGTIYGNEYKDPLTDLYAEKTLRAFDRIRREMRITILNFALWRMKKPWEVPPRRIDDTVLWIVREGEFRCTAGDASQLLHRGEGFAAPEETRHSMAFAPGCGEGSVIVIHLKLRSYPGDSPFAALRTPFFRLSSPQEFFHTVERAIALKNISPEFAGKCVTERIRELLMEWSAEDLLPPESSRSCDARIREALDFIYRNLGSDIAVQDIAAAAGLHEVRFRKIFREQTGMTPLACLKQARLERVGELLIKTLLPLSELAAQTGFGTPSYLCSVFRAYSGRTPQEYRQLYQQRYRE